MGVLDAPGLPGNLPELLHPGDDVVHRLDTRRELNVEQELRRTELSRCHHVVGNLLKGAGEVGALLTERRIGNLDVGADDEFQRR